MDKITAFGSILAFSCLLIGLKLGGGEALAFWDFPSVLVVFGGSAGSLCISYSWPRVTALFRQIRWAYVAPPDFDYLKAISNILQISEVARKEGILALDSKIAEIENPFLQRGLQMVVDGVDVKIIEEVMTTELDSRAARHADVKASIDFYASIVPAYGLMGTILGLVGLLRNMDDPSAIGPAMALALITTFYGAVAANMFLMPWAKKLEERSNNEQLYGEMIARGCLLIAGGVHPRIIQERLLAYLSDKLRTRFNELHLSEELKAGG
ncbi:MAG TPA: MotA/TolQ/ExbB proton channel family protein [Candidatus Ozemobacteraceae bacterium]